MNAPAHGLLAGFADVPTLLAALRALRRDGFGHLEVHSPFAVPGLDEVLSRPREPVHRRIAFWVLLGGLIGGFGMLALQVWSAVLSYPIDVGGRPDASWPAFLPPALEMALLGAFVFGVVAMLAGSRLPKLHQPIFASTYFERASQDRFMVLILADAPGYDAERARQRLLALGAEQIEEVPA
ncbi:MAG: DUF3341 domain-containing protein [Xanthomonadales bacterium]|nr:DUF3341 domain-containing protein [Xanthomonadales bacterium]